MAALLSSSAAQWSSSLDLAEHHSPLSKLFVQPTTAEEWAKYALSQEQIEHFRKNGFITGVRILSEEQCDALLAELDGMCQPDHPRYDCWYTEGPKWGDPEQTLLHALGAWRVGVGFHDLLWAPAFRMAACVSMHRLTIRRETPGPPATVANWGTRVSMQCSMLNTKRSNETELLWCLGFEQVPASRWAIQVLPRPSICKATGERRRGQLSSRLFVRMR